MIALVIALFLATMAIWQRSIILYAFAFPVALVYGLNAAASEDVNSPMWVAGVTVAMMGLYFLYCIVLIGIERWKTKARGRE